MKNLFKVIVALFAVSLFAFAEPISEVGEKNGYDVKLSSEKSLVVGTNEMFIEISKDGKLPNKTKVKIKFYMPEMPGMPYMEFEDKGKLVDGKYKVNINFSMGGTWQYQLKFKTEDGKVHKVRGSVNI